jgi:sulfide:quinone oxidoreductase
MSHHSITIIGAGTAGITVAAQLLRKNSNLDIAIIDPSKDHWYQPAWTLVGADTFEMSDTRRDQKDLIPEGAKWIQQRVSKLMPQDNAVLLDNGDTITYDALVVAPGVEMHLDGIEGLREAMGKGGVCSNYIDPEYTKKVLKEFKGGNAVFTQAATPIKCGGAPQKIMYLAAELFRKTKVFNDTNIIFATPGSVVFGVKDFLPALMNVINRHSITVKFFHNITKIDPVEKKVYFKITTNDESNCIAINEKQSIGEEILGDATIVMKYDMLHLAPPQRAPQFVRESAIAHKEGPNTGWANVNIHSMQNPDFPNVFALGDVAALPTAKTGAAVRKQAPVVVDNILSILEGKQATNEDYNGYSSCPLVTGYGKMVLAEFGYGNKRMSDPLISTFVDTTKEKYSMWLLKKFALPFMYWKLMLKGKA